MDTETYQLLVALEFDQENALNADHLKINREAANEIRTKIFESDLTEDLKEPLSNFVSAKLLTDGAENSGV